MRHPRVEALTAPEDELGEGILWDVTDQRVLWIDIVRRLVRSYDPASGELETLAIERAPTSLAPRSSCGFILTVDTGVATLGDDLRNPPAPWLALQPGHRGTRVNDAKCGPGGRLFAGTKHEDDGSGEGILYRIDPDGTVTRAIEGVTNSNGLGWSPEGTTMYYVDTPTHRIDALDYDPRTGEVSGRRRFVEIDPADGIPDGMTIDAEGGIWIALWGGSAIRRYLPDGTLDRIVDVPASQPTNCCFGGPKLRDLYITTARADLSPEQLAEEPLAGALLRVAVDVQGVPAAAFGEG